jgi:ribosome-binding protein aMBF1 (putative translation factor)
VTVIQLPTTQKSGQQVSRPCDICGQSFASKNAAAARAMLAGKLRVCDTCRRAGARTQLPYSEYLKTEGWKTRRTAAIKRAGHACQVCKSPERLEVHHNTYERLGHELAADLIVLCRNCHQTFHDNGELKY